LVTLVIAAPLLISVIARTFGWIVVLGPNGLANALFHALGLVTDPVPLLFTEAAIVVGLVHVLLPYMVLSIAASLEAIDGSLVRAARSLGASPRVAFLRVTLPLSLHGLIAGSLIVFALSSASFVTPAILGGSQLKVTSSLVYQQTLVLFNWPFGGAIAMIMLALTSILIASASLRFGARSRPVLL
jgi:putative spermidine/putrescine transport system permease protein